MDKGLMAKDEWQNLGLNFSEDEKQAEQLLEKKNG
jgi:hypothetical protein